MLDLIAVAYEAPDETHRFLLSVREHLDVPFTLTIVENSSPDKRVRTVLNDFTPMVYDNPYCMEKPTVVYSNENMGYARACNLGATYGEAPWLALLNMDVEFLQGAASAIIRQFKASSDIAVIGPKTVDSRNRFTHGGIVVDHRGLRSHRGWQMVDHGQYDDVLEVETVAGATYFMRRDVWQDLTQCPLYQQVASGAEGAFLPTKHYYEETFTSLHARNHGWKVLYCGRVKMIHQWHRSSAQGGAAERHMSKSKEYFEHACAAHSIDTLGH